MYVKLEPFWVCAYGEMLGSTRFSLIEAVIKNWEETFDEGRRRLSLQNVRVRSSYQSVSDPVIDCYANKENINKIIELTFKKAEMYDFDVNPSFSPGSKSYHARLEEWKMIEYVVERLSLIPESKKAIISFIHRDDYKAVLANPKDDYLPCITTVQFRLIDDDEGGYRMNTIFTARSLDVFQKWIGNIVAIGMMSEMIAQKLKENLKKAIKVCSLDWMVTDVHIYTENIYDAQELLKKYKKNQENA